MSTTPSKRIGRPKKSPAEKGDQFSIRLSALDRLHLEIFARYRNLSLSQAVSALIKETVPHHKMGDVGLIDEYDERLSKAMKSLVPHATKISRQGEAAIAAEWLVEKHHQLQTTEQGKAMLMPVALLTPEEKYFVIVAESLKEPVLSSLDIPDMYPMIRAMFNVGMPVEDAIVSAQGYEQDVLKQSSDPSQAVGSKPEPDKTPSYLDRAIEMLTDTVDADVAGSSLDHKNPRPRGPAQYKKPSSK